MIVPTRTVNCRLQPWQRQRKRALRVPSFAFICVTSMSPQRGQAGSLPQRCSSMNAIAVASSEQAPGIRATRADLERERLGMLLLYYTHRSASSTRFGDSQRQAEGEVKIWRV